MTYFYNRMLTLTHLSEWGKSNSLSRFTLLFDTSDRSQYEQHIGKPFIQVNPIPYYEQGGRDLMHQMDVLVTQRITIKPMENLKIRAEFLQTTHILKLRIKEQELVRLMEDRLLIYQIFST